MPITEYPETLGVGPQGERGYAGGMSFDYRFDTGTGVSPASGEIRFNHATPGSATAVYIHDTDANGADLDALLDTLAAGDLVIIKSTTNPASFHVFSITGNTDAGTYHNLAVTYLAGAGTFDDAENIIFSLAKKGSSGAFPLVDVTYKTDGSFDTSSTTFVDVTGASVTWTQVTAGYAKVEVVGCFGALSGGTAHDAIMGVQVDGGTDFPLTGTEEYTDGSGNDSKLKPCSGGIVFSGVSAGSHTVKIRLRRRAVVGTNAQLCAETDLPLRLTVFHS